MVMDAISDLKEQISQCESQIQLIENLDFNKKLTEDEWHELCETPLRSSELLSVFVKNIFPEATNINVHCNYVYFELMEYKIQIPTSRARGINVACNWYSPPTICCLYTNDSLSKMEKYFEALDRNAGWKELASLRCRLHKNDFNLFIWWFFYAKWKKLDRKSIEKEILDYKVKQNEKLEKYKENCKKTYEKLKWTKENLLPVLNSFSDKHYCYNDNGYSISEITSDENMKRLLKEMTNPAYKLFD